MSNRKTRTRISRLSILELRALLRTQACFDLTTSEFELSLRRLRRAYGVDARFLSGALRCYIGMHPETAKRFQQTLCLQMKSRRWTVSNNALFSLHLLPEANLWQIKLLIRRLTSKNEYTRLDASYTLAQLLRSRRRLSAESYRWIVDHIGRKLDWLQFDDVIGPNVRSVVQLACHPKDKP